MTRAPLALAAALAICAGGCASRLAVRGPGETLPRAAAAGAFAVRATIPDLPRERTVDALALLEASLLARGASEVVRTEEPTPGLAQLELFLVGSRSTPLTRWTMFPLGIATLATLGLVPFREAHEHFVEVHAVLPQAPPGRRIRIARRSYVDVSWAWLPLVLLPHHGSSLEEQRAIHAKGLALAIDAALDDVLARDPPGPLAQEPPPDGGR